MDHATLQPAQQQTLPGKEALLQPQADHGERSYKGSGKLTNKAAIITGGDRHWPRSGDRLCAGRR